MLCFRNMESFVKIQFEESLTTTDAHLNVPEIQTKNVVLPSLQMFSWLQVILKSSLGIFPDVKHPLTILYSVQKVWHGEENEASWKVFENPSSAAFMFDNDRTSYYGSETNDSKNRKIEILFNEPIFFDKIVIMKSHLYYRRGCNSYYCDSYHMSHVTWYTLRGEKRDTKVESFRDKYKNVCLYLDEKMQSCTLSENGFVTSDADFISWSAQNDFAISKGMDCFCIFEGIE